MRNDEATGANTGERLQKILAAHGVASRRGAEEMIARGEVTVNGAPANLGQRVDEHHDLIAVRGRPLQERRPRTYMALNKPTGYVTTLSATHGERTVQELVPRSPRVFPVGRLDKETSGLLLLTDDGDWAEGIMHPRFQVEKEYRVLVRGRPSREDLEALRNGVVLPDGVKTAPARVTVIKEREIETELEITVIEGKKRQIRLMCAALRHPVVQLQRVRVGSIRLGTLKEGRWRVLTSDEIAGVRRGQTSGGDARRTHADRRHRRPSGSR